MSERQKFDLIKKIGPVEIRRYHACVMADVVVNSEYRNAGNIGFRPLVTYISQNKIAMTAPVVQEQNQAGSWVVSFVMPAHMQLSDLPLPKSSQVALREIHPRTAAVISFSGTTSWHRVKEKESELREVLEKEKLEATGPMQIARFDPPWKPGFMRHNEIVIPIRERI